MTFFDLPCLQSILWRRGVVNNFSWPLGTLKGRNDFLGISSFLPHRDASELTMMVDQSRARDLNVDTLDDDDGVGSDENVNVGKARFRSAVTESQ